MIIKIIINYFDMSLELVKINNYIDGNVFSLSLIFFISLIAICFGFYYICFRRRRRGSNNQATTAIVTAVTLIPIVYPEGFPIAYRVSNTAVLTPLELGKLKARIWAFKTYGIRNFR